MAHAVTTTHGGGGGHDHPDMAAVDWGRLTYWTIFAILIVLTIVTVGLAIAVEFKNELINVVIALLIAFAKATFVARYFMHLKFEGKLIWIIFVVPLGLCVLLTAALIPDVGYGRSTSFNDTIGAFMGISSAEPGSGKGASAAESPHE